MYNLNTELDMIHTTGEEPAHLERAVTLFDKEIRKLLSRLVRQLHTIHI